MKSLAIIPARGGSKRIERKNIKEFAGAPIIAYSIRAAIHSGCFDEVMVSTDDEEIAEVARKYGASVPFMRSEATSNDFATTADVIREVLDRYAEMGEEFDTLACIYATAPFITSERLREGDKMLRDGECEAAFTCVEYSYPTQRCLAIDDSGRIAMKFPEYAQSRSQDLQKTYHDAGQFYFTTVKAFLESGTLWGPDTRPIILPEMEVQDLDTLQDWELAEMKHKLLLRKKMEARKKETEGKTLPDKIKAGGYTFVSYTLLDSKDSELMRQGRNAPAVRENSINQEEITPEQHSEFVKSLALRDDCRYYGVYNSHLEPVGTVNLKLTSGNSADRGIWIFDTWKGMGYATSLLRALYEWLSANSPIERIETTVRVGNESSHRLEQRLGAIEKERDEEYVHYELKL